MGVVSLAREIDFREEFCFAACRTATLFDAEQSGGDGQKKSGVCLDMLSVGNRQSYSSGCFSGNLDWSSPVAAQQFDVSGAFGKCTKEHIKECPSCCDTSLVRFNFSPSRRIDVVTFAMSPCSGAGEFTSVIPP